MVPITKWPQTGCMAGDRKVGELGEFLHASRGRVTPGDVGLGDSVSRRRVPGLRREEIAMLAGVSASYYTRLEQGQARGASSQVLDALAAALQLNDSERNYLRTLSQISGFDYPAQVPEVEWVDQQLAELLESMDGVPALILGRRRDILAWNELGHALLAGHINFTSAADPGRRPNATEMVFLDAHTRDLYVNWDDKARAVVGHLRILAAQFPHDPDLASMIGRLSMESAEFSALWADHRVKSGHSVEYVLRHPAVGMLTVTQQTLTASQAPEQSLVACTTDRGSSSFEAVKLLAQLVGSHSGARD
jgi:transcriptional regulator with XRE-family HTH domain